MATTDGLTKDQREEYNTHITTDTMFGQFQTLVDGYLPLKAEVTAHKLNLKAITDKLPDKTKNSTIITEQKNIVRTGLENKYGVITKIALSFATTNDHADLATAMTNGNANLGLQETPDLNFNLLITGINTSINPFITDAVFTPYGITALMLTSGKTDVDAFTAGLGKNKQVAESVSVATDEVELLFIPIRGNFTGFRQKMEFFNPIGGILPKDTFYNSMKESMILQKLASPHTTLDGNIYTMVGTDKVVIKNAQVKNLKTGKIGISDLLGNYEITKFTGGTFEFEISAPHFQTIKVVIKILRGKHLTMDFALLAVI